MASASMLTGLALAYVAPTEVDQLVSVGLESRERVVSHRKLL